MPSEQVELTTADGRCPTWLHRPEGEGPWPAVISTVIVYMDAVGVRPALSEMAERRAVAAESRHRLASRMTARYWETLLALLTKTFSSADA